MPHVNWGGGERALAADSFSLSTWGWTPWLDSVSFLLTRKLNSSLQVIEMCLPWHTLCFWSTLTISSAAAFSHTCCTPTFQSPSSWSLLTFPSPTRSMQCAFGRIRKGKEKLKQWLLPSKLQSNQSISGNLWIKSLLLLYFATKATAFSPSCCVIFIAGKISAPKSTAHLCHPGTLNALWTVPETEFCWTCYSPGHGCAFSSDWHKPPA